jgi:hypothetical protein
MNANVAEHSSTARVIVILALVAMIITGIAIAVVYYWVISDPKAAAMENRLRKELALLQPPQGAILIREGTYHKPLQALVEGNYESQLAYQELCDYYDREMARQGWTFVEDRPIKDWGRALGGRNRRYQKDDLAAELFYPGQEANSGYTYALGLSWGQHSP